MIKMKRVMSLAMIMSMMMGSFAPSQSVLAKQNEIVAAYGEENTQVTSEATTQQSSTEATTQQPSTEVTTEQPSTEMTTQQSSTEVTTEQPGTEATTEKENSTQEKPNEEIKTSKYADTGLSPLKAKVIVIDPGHCSKHTGASGNGLKEEKVTLDISLACRDYLEDYDDVIVYLTREDGSCCAQLGVGECLAGRNNYSKLMDADFLVSMHINAGSSSGANVLAAYKSGYNDSIRKQTQDFGKIALAKLKEIGIANRGFLLRKSGSGNRYPNGSLCDYYSIVRRGVVQQIPSVIIEHGYITSSSDCSKFFKTKAKRKKVGQADAKAIVEYYNLSKNTLKGSFKEVDGETYFENANSEKMSGWVKNDGKWYYFDPETAKMSHGFVTIEDKVVYLSPSTGELITGWFTVNSTKYFSKGNGELVRNQSYSDGVYTYLFNSNGKLLKKGLHAVNGNTYYVNSKKHVVTDCVQKVSGKYYGFDEDGKQVYGYQRINGRYYYFDLETGVMAKKKMVKLEDGTYYFGSKGVRQTGWITYKKEKYFFNISTGKMSKGWKKISGKYYYFSKKNGKMQKDKKIGKYYVNSNGVRTKKK